MNFIFRPKSHRNFTKWFAWFPVYVAKLGGAELRWLTVVEVKCVRVAPLTSSVFWYRDVEDTAYYYD